MKLLKRLFGLKRVESKPGVIVNTAATKFLDIPIVGDIYELRDGCDSFVKVAHVSMDRKFVRCVFIKFVGIEVANGASCTYTISFFHETYKKWNDEESNN